MADIKLILQAGQGTIGADVAWAGDDLASGHDLETAVAISLFSDRHASPDYVFVDGTQNPRGWWADADNGYQIGSRIWQYSRATRTTATRLALIDACREALAWMIEEGVASAVAVDAYYVGDSGVQLTVNLTQSSGTLASLKYQFLWANP